MGEILGQRRNYASRDPDETIALMRLVDFDFQIAPRDSGNLDFVANGAYMPNSYVGYVHYGAAACVRDPGWRSRLPSIMHPYFIHLPARGKCETENWAGRFTCQRGQGVISPPSGHVMRSQAGSSRITLSFTHSSLIDRLTTLIGDTPVKPLEFAPTIDLTSLNGRRFARQVRLLITDLDDASTGHNEILLAAYDELIATGLLLCQPHNYTAALERLERKPATHSVRRAIDYMEDQLETPVTLDGIVAASGVPGRSLLRHFHNHRGTSPMRYLRDARLARVREALLRADADDSVTRIATSHGVQHLGRFAGDYRKRFGESPSETLKRGRSQSRSRKM